MYLVPLTGQNSLETEERALPAFMVGSAFIRFAHLLSFNILHVFAVNSSYFNKPKLE